MSLFSKIPATRPDIKKMNYKNAAHQEVRPPGRVRPPGEPLFENSVDEADFDIKKMNYKNAAHQEVRPPG